MTIIALFFTRAGKWSKAEVKDALESLEEKGLTRAMSEGIYVRQHSIDTQVLNLNLCTYLA